MEIKRINEILNVEYKIERLLGELKKDKYITSYLRNGNSEVIIELGVNDGCAYEHNMETKVVNNEIKLIHHDIHNMVMSRFIKKKFRNIEINSEIFNDYSNLFRPFVLVRNEHLEKLYVDNFFEFISDKVDKSKGEDFIKVLGPDGTGKSTFLSILYLYLYDGYCNRKLSEYPFYINLRFYDENVIEADDMEELNNVVKQQIQEDLKELIELSTKYSSNFLIIIDGNDRYDRTHLKSGSILEDILDEIKGHKKIISLGEKTSVHFFRDRKASGCIDNDTAYTFHFSPIYINENNKWKDIISRYCKHFQYEKHIEKINVCIAKFNIKEIDYNLLTIFCDVAKRTNLESISSISDLYYQYCLNHLGRNERKLEISVDLAYTYFMTKEFIPQKYISSHWKEWELVHQHKTISNYLLACHYSELIFEEKTENVKQFECVFTNGINIFLKAIINETNEQQRKTIEFCQKAFEVGEFRAQAQAAYLAGRVKNDNFQHAAKSLLNAQSELQGSKPKRGDRKREWCFVKRSIWVSLLYLGESLPGEILLDKLFEDPIMNEVNRAFYLQYYEDNITIEPENISFKDDGKHKITHTYSILINGVREQLSKDELDWSTKECIQFQILLFTLCSLIQQRLLNKQYLSEIESVYMVIKETNESLKNKLEDNMRIYIAMLQEDIESGAYNIGHLYNELYAAKDILRSGWIKKIKKGSMQIDKYENIIEHTYYAWLLGMIYLPDNPPAGEKYKKYNKKKILNCLLIHDLAETYIGDKLPEETTGEHKQKENECMQKIFMHQMYSDVGSMVDYKNIWQNFDLNSSDINGKIAKEIDVIQAIYQYCIYKRKGAQFLDNKDKEWKKEKNKIKTYLGRKILEEVVLKNFEDVLMDNKNANEIN